MGLAVSMVSGIYGACCICGVWDIWGLLYLWCEGYMGFAVSMVCGYMGLAVSMVCGYMGLVVSMVCVIYGACCIYGVWDIWSLLYL